MTTMHLGALAAAALMGLAGHALAADPAPAAAAAATTATTTAAATPLALTAPSATHGPVRAAQATPNIVMLLMDDLDTNVWENALSRGLLPRMQNDIVMHGTTFDNMFVALSACCPSRTSMLTGRYPHNHGIIRNQGKSGGFESFTADNSTIAVWMKAAGYRTGLMGKYLNGYGRSPRDNGGTYIPPGWDSWWGMTSTEQFDYYVSEQGVPTHYGTADTDYQTDVLSGKAQAFLASDDPRPFFLVLTPTAPHFEGGGSDDDAGGTIRPAPRYADTPSLTTIPPETLASFNEADMSDKPVWMRSLPPVDAAGVRSGYNQKVAAIRAVDDLLGAVVDTLKSKGRYGDTLIMITSDNGFQYGTHRKIQKTDTYEESIRVPMVIHAPGQVKPHRVATWAMNIDWAPTFADAAHATPDVIFDGQSLMPWVMGGAGPDRKSMLAEWPPTNGFLAAHPPFSTIRSRDPAITLDATGNTTLVYVETLDKNGKISDKEFYDLSIDPLQMQSLHTSTMPKRVKQMRQLSAELAILRGCVGDTCRVY